MDMQEKVKQMSPNLLLFYGFNVNKISNETRKKQIRNNLKKKLRNAQLELEIQGTQKVLSEFEERALMI